MTTRTQTKKNTKDNNTKRAVRKTTNTPSRVAKEELKAQVYSQAGKEVGVIALPKSVFGLPWNVDVVRQVVLGMAANKRTPVAHTKDRSEVRGGGKKPWRQKGTGRARHGSSRSPLWRGGGITFGPRNIKNYFQKLNKKMKAKALYVALSRKLRDNELVFIDRLIFTEPKTREAKKVLESLSRLSVLSEILSKKNNSVLITLPLKDSVAEKSFSNLGNVMVKEVRNLNAWFALKYKYVLIVNPEQSIAFLEAKMGKTQVKDGGKEVKE